MNNNTEVIIKTTSRSVIISTILDPYLGSCRNIDAETEVRESCDYIQQSTHIWRQDHARQSNSIYEIDAVELGVSCPKKCCSSRIDTVGDHRR